MYFKGCCKTWNRDVYNSPFPVNLGKEDNSSDRVREENIPRLNCYERSNAGDRRRGPAD